MRLSSSENYVDVDEKVAGGLEAEADAPARICGAAAISGGQSENFLVRCSQLFVYAYPSDECVAVYSYRL